VPDAGLQSLPFGVLITAKPVAPPGEIAEYRQFAWLAKKYAIASLPAEVSLRALRRFAKVARAEQPIIGLGNPLLEGASGPARTLQAAALFPRGAIANVDEVRKLPRLPETADELRQIARAPGAKPQDLYPREAATETNLKRLDLSRYRTLAFATYGLMEGEFRGMAEPALVLTPPKQGTAIDDGRLTASEVAELKLNADWVILSACNTAASDGTPGAAGFSGLAKAFLYAGSRALLVTHWSVPSDAATELTTRLFREHSANPGIGRAQALRRAMLLVMNDPQKSQFAHPTYWAPFALVGEGG
jgi:CHAT domain-containing protein